jgi:mono/diheme cytochrome c family protein
MKTSRLALGLLPLLVLSAALPLALTAARAQDAAATTPATFTQAQVEGGRASYSQFCVDCHGANHDDGEFGGAPLKGTAFKDKWFGVTADALYGFVSTAMPPDRPGKLNPQTYADLVAYILSRNGVQPGASELPSDLEKLATLTVQ